MRMKTGVSSIKKKKALKTSSLLEDDDDVESVRIVDINPSLRPSLSKLFNRLIVRE